MIQNQTVKLIESVGDKAFNKYKVRWYRSKIEPLHNSDNTSELYKGFFVFKKMNIELLHSVLEATAARNCGVRILGPNELSTPEKSTHLVDLLQKMYVKHGIVQNLTKLAEDIDSGNVLPWFAKKDNKFIATASLIKQGDGSWEVGRAVCLEGGNGLGKHVILQAVKFHIENHWGAPLVAEVRAADEYKGVPSGLATQKIFLGLMNKIAGMTPYGIAPLFSHGSPIRNETFILSSSDAPSGQTISGRIFDATNNRSTRGTVKCLEVVQHSPFRLAVPSDTGIGVNETISDSLNTKGCTFLPIETTDENMPLIGLLSADKNVVVCGVDRVMGREGKPVLFMAMLGRGTLLAPTRVNNDILSWEMRNDIQAIADKFK